MARANLSTTRGLVYEKLGVSNGFGTLKTNARYTTAFIDQAIASADIEIAKLLFVNKQDSLMKEAFTTTTIQHGDEMPQNWAVLSVEWDITGGGSFVRAVEIDWNKFSQMASGGIYDVSTYKGYYTIKDNKLYTIPNSTDFRITYLNLTRPTSLTALRCPEGFEEPISDKASAKLLMKRGDKPDRSEYYENQATMFLQTFMLPELNTEEQVDKE